MSDINVSTFSALKNALANVTAGDNIYITADMDGSNYPIASASDNINIANSCTIHGQGHSIYNITCTADTGVYCIVSPHQTEVVWRDTNFYNIFTKFTNRTPFISEQSSTGSARPETLNVINCNFQGQFGNLFGKGRFSKCAVNGTGSLSRNLTNTGRDMVYYDYLYVNLKNNPSVTGYYLAYPEHVSNCYFSGSVDVSEWAADQSIFAGRGPSSPYSRFYLNNCIINLDIISNAAATYKWYAGANTDVSPQGVTLFNTSKIQNITFSQSSDLLIPMADADLKNAEAVAATGFPIIV